ncbi:MAG TPA: hypothetical protein VHC48_14205, partial [Puia sp.]|nr:hypothetical protein [Puia sp.]
KTLGGKREMTLGPVESRLVVFGEGAGDFEGRVGKRGGIKGDEVVAMDALLGARDGVRSGGVEVKGPWEVTFHHVNGVSKTVTLQELQAFGEDSEWNSFAGTIEYRGMFRMDKLNGRTWLDLGHLRDVSTLEMNGRRLGVRWYGEHLYEITDAFAAGDNYLTIRVVTTLGNYMKTLKHNRAAHAWTRRSPYYPAGLTEVILRG